MANNYETMKLQMRDEFLKYDQSVMIEKFGLRSDDENIYITFFGTEYAVDRSTGDVRFDHCDAASIFVETDTGDVSGTLLTAKRFVTETSTGNVRVPQSDSGGKCEIHTTTGDITIAIP